MYQIQYKLEKCVKLTLVVFSFLLVSGSAISQEEEDQKQGWKGTAGANALVNTGNAVNQTLSGNFVVSNRKDKDKLEFNGIGAYGRAEDANGNASTNTKNWRTQLRYDRFVSERVSSFAYGHGGQDEPAGFDARYGGGAGISHQLVDDGQNAFKYEGGYDYTRENRIPPGIDDDVHSARIFLQYKRKISDWADFSQDIENLINVETIDDYRLNTLTALTTKLSKTLAFQFGVSVRYDNQPVEGRRKVDTSSQAGLVLNFL